MKFPWRRDRRLRRKWHSYCTSVIWAHFKLRCSIGNWSFIYYMTVRPSWDWNCNLEQWNSDGIHIQFLLHILCNQCRRDAVIPSKSIVGTATNALWFVFLFTKTAALYHIMAEKIWETWPENPIQVRQNATSLQPWYRGSSDFEMEHHLSKEPSEAHRSWFRVTTLNMIFSVTYYLELRNAITVYCSSHFWPTKSNWLFGHYRTLTFFTW